MSKESVQLFEGTACFSPSVPPIIRQAWVEYGGRVAISKDEQRFSDWFFCDGMSDPWLRVLSSKMIAVFHANWIMAAVREQFPIPLAKYVLDDRYESLNEPASDDFSVLESPSASYTDSDSHSSLDEEEECENLLSSDHHSSVSISNGYNPAMTHFAQTREEALPMTIDGTQTQLGHRRASSLPAARHPHVVHKYSSVGNAEKQCSHDLAGLSSVTDSVSITEFNQSSNLRTIVSLLSGPGKKPHEFEIALIPSARRVAPSISSSVANQVNWGYSSLPQDLWGLLVPTKSITGSHLPIPTKDAIAVLKLIPIADIALFIPGELHLDKEFIYNGNDRRKTI